MTERARSCWSVCARPRADDFADRGSAAAAAGAGEAAKGDETAGQGHMHLSPCARIPATPCSSHVCVRRARSPALRPATGIGSHFLRDVQRSDRGHPTSGRNQRATTPPTMRRPWAHRRADTCIVGFRSPLSLSLGSSFPRARWTDFHRCMAAARPIVRRHCPRHPRRPVSRSTATP